VRAVRAAVHDQRERGAVVVHVGHLRGKATSRPTLRRPKPPDKPHAATMEPHAATMVSLYRAVLTGRLQRSK
jgi:hypothetical protein